MLLFPNCKINIGLNITRKREDGFHDLETIFYPLPLCDALEAIESEGEDESISLTGLDIDGNVSNNLCVKAYDLLRKDFPEIPPVKMHLHKLVPMGAGLGGGSSDGAFMLQLLNQKFGLGLSQERLIEYALQLGSDCPFFIINKPCFATGRGEKLQEIDLDLKGWYIVLIHPGIHVSTKSAFEGITPKQPALSIKDIIRQPIETWKDNLVNDFEKTVFSLHPSLAQIKKDLYETGAVYASMTGTGSSVYGIFKTVPEMRPDLFANAKVNVVSCEW